MLLNLKVRKYDNFKNIKVSDILIHNLIFSIYIKHFQNNQFSADMEFTSGS